MWVYVTSTGYNIPRSSTLRKDGSIAFKGRVFGKVPPSCMTPSLKISEIKNFGEKLGVRLAVSKLQERFSIEEIPCRKNESQLMLQKLKTIQDLREVEHKISRISNRFCTGDVWRKEEERCNALVYEINQKMANLSLSDCALIDKIEKQLSRNSKQFSCMSIHQLKYKGLSLPRESVLCASTSIVCVFPGWYAASKKIKTKEDVVETLEFVRSRYDRDWFEKAEMQQVALPAVPPCLCPQLKETAFLQNMNARNFAKVSLCSRWIVNALPKCEEIRRVCRDLSLGTSVCVVLCQIKKSNLKRPNF